MIRRIVFVAAALLVANMLIAEPAVAADPVLDEQTFVAKINALRASHGVRPLSTDPTLTNVARRWAYKMAVDGHISHRRDLSVGAPRTWMFLGENVGQGYDVHSLHDMFVASPGHFANLVNPRFESIGVGVVWVGSWMFVAEEFMQGGYTVAKVKKKCFTRRCRRARSRLRIA